MRLWYGNDGGLGVLSDSPNRAHQIRYAGETWSSGNGPVRIYPVSRNGRFARLCAKRLSLPLSSFPLESRSCDRCAAGRPRTTRSYRATKRGYYASGSGTRGRKAARHE